MKSGNLLAVLFVFALTYFTFLPGYSQTSEGLLGRWEGVHYYGDTTRLVNGTLIVRSITIDSMRMILTIDQVQDGTFKGKLHEHFYSDPKKHYFNADITGSIKNDQLKFTSFDIKENRLPSGYRWCPPKATGVLVKSLNSLFLHMAFESTLTCTVGPAIVERKITQNVAQQPAPVVPPVTQPKAETTPPKATNLNVPPKHDITAIAENFRRRTRVINSTFRVTSDSIKINFFDNGTIDGDSISVFVNGQLRVSHIGLTTAVYSFKLGFPKGSDEIEVAMFAENLGSIPPNTALMQIVDGTKVHQAYLSSDITSNAVIKIRKVSSLSSK